MSEYRKISAELRSLKREYSGLLEAEGESEKTQAIRKNMHSLVRELKEIEINNMKQGFKYCLYGNYQKTF